ncbi:hypothetical protein KY328_00970 [Candidatus Woesearchaeota archaeon]|nr:hypothetical protein [Candidatus Woesearchaeota archaeon]MBW3021468.1 hypothetical protein [Candidatus Woesearchaeota archaeon]
MGYVEDIQKINKLAKELLDHKMADSLDEAVVQAKGMLKNDIDLAKIPNPGTDYQEEVKVEKINSQTLQEHERKLKAIEEDKKEPDISWQEAMAKNNEYIVGMMKKFESAVHTFNNELCALRRKVASLEDGQKVVNLVKEQASEPVQQPQQQAAPQPAPQAQQQQSSHPKTGSSDPSQFSVEKIFYYGKK